VGGGGSYGSGKAPSGQEEERRRSGGSRALLARHPGKGLLRHPGGGARGAGGGGLKRHSRQLGEASECGAALGIPKVALLFLTKGPMPLEQVQPSPPASCPALLFSGIQSACCALWKASYMPCPGCRLGDQAKVCKCPSSRGPCTERPQ
jgi:hypothetical protein